MISDRLTRDKMLCAIASGSTNNQIAKDFGCGTKTVSRLREKYAMHGGRWKRLITPDFDELTNDVLIGHLLGDGSLRTPFSINGDSSFCMSQSAARIEYLQHLSNKLFPWSLPITTERVKKPTRVNGKVSYNDIDWRGEYTEVARLRTRTHPIFTSMRQRWYLDPYKKKSQKIVPPDTNLNWRIVAFWFMDDGNNNLSKKRLTLSTNSFAQNDVDYLIAELDRLAIYATCYKQDGRPTINIGARSYFDFIDHVKPFIQQFHCFGYKIETKGAGKERLDIYQCGSLSEIDIAEVCDAHKSRRLTINEIAKWKQVSIATISRVIRSPTTNPHYDPNGGRKLTPSIVKTIVNLWNDGVMSQSRIAEQLGIQQTLVSQIVTRKVWTDITKDFEIRKSGRI